MGCSNNKKNTPSQKGPDLKVTAATQQKKTIETKIVLLGEQNVGKSSIAQRYCKNIFSDKHVATIGGAYFQQKVQTKGGNSLLLHIWDTGGQERFRAMASLYYKDATAALLCYDVTNKESLSNLNYWIEQLKENGTSQTGEPIIICIAGNKCDVPPSEKKVSFDELRIFAKENNVEIFMETSAKSDIGIKELFGLLAQKIYESQNKT